LIEPFGVNASWFKKVDTGDSMPPYTVLSWENGLDLIGILLCLLIITWLIYNRRKYRRLFPSSSKTTDSQRTILVEWLRQLSDDALDAITNKVNAEQRQRQQWLSTVGSGQVGGLGELSSLSQTVHTEDSDGYMSGYAQLSAMADAGLTTDQMAERCNVPLDEIDLYLKARHVKVET
jgi:hypothetical protein